MSEESPICYIIAGPNGAGKTTFATEFLPKEGESELFVNSDLIASGLSPFNPAAAEIEASRLMLEQIDRYANQRRTFAFETTLSGKTHIDRIRNMKVNGYTIMMFYIMLEEIELSLIRINDRVRNGGHNIPENDARRRFPRSITNILTIYSKLADAWKIYDNTTRHFRLVAASSSKGIKIINKGLYEKLKRNAK